MITSCIIVTKDRPAELKRCLQSLQQQTRLPDQTIVVEGGAVPAPQQHGIDYSRSQAGITHQRNVARAMVRNDVDIVIFLDDDTIIPRETIERITQIFTAKPDIVGLTSRMMGEPEPSHLKQLLAPLTLLYTRRPFGITHGLFNSINTPKRPQAVEWLPGAFMCYRWSHVKTLQFDEHFSGYGLAEDLDYSIQARTFGHLWVDPTITITHNRSPLGRDWQQFGYMRIVNRNYIRRKHFQGKFLFWFGMWWANSWLLIINGLRSFLSSRYQAEFTGECKGVLDILKKL